jgi:hypothetical protein
MTDRNLAQAGLVATFHISSLTINSGDAVGRYTGIRVLLFSSKNF